MLCNVSQAQLFPPLHGALHLRLGQRAESRRVLAVARQPLLVHVDHQHAFAERAPRDELEVLRRQKQILAARPAALDAFWV